MTGYFRSKPPGATSGLPPAGGRQIGVCKAMDTGRTRTKLVDMSLCNATT